MSGVETIELESCVFSAITVAVCSLVSVLSYFRAEVCLQSIHNWFTLLTLKMADFKFDSHFVRGCVGGADETAGTE